MRATMSDHDITQPLTDNAEGPMIKILGPIEVWNARQRLALGGPKQLMLFAFLALHANRAVSSDSLIDAVWGPERSRAANRLKAAVCRLRRALAPIEESGGIALRSVVGGYMLAVRTGMLDAEVLEARVQEGRRALAGADPARAVELLAGALRLWRGEPLAEVAFEGFAQPDARRLDELRLAAIEARFDGELQLGRHLELAGELEALALRHPTRERLAAQLIIALYRSGRQADALESYQRTRAHLAREFGLEPGPALKELQTQVLQHDPSLEQTDGEGAGSTPREAQRARETRVGLRAHRSFIPVGPRPDRRQPAALGLRDVRDAGNTSTTTATATRVTMNVALSLRRYAVHR
jgi:DNA-binding SARP family transcriptional activator